MAVEMEGVESVDYGEVLDHPVYPFVFHGYGVDVVVCGEDAGAVGDGFEGWLRPVDLEGGGVECPVEY